MIFYYVIILFLSRSQARGIEDGREFENPDLHDQLAIATDNVERRVEQSQTISNIEYKNSNGFVPIITPAPISSSSIEVNQQVYPTSTSRSQVDSNLEGSDGNRRSFDSQSTQQNEFELLKVTNNTPEIANYQQFYHNLHNNLNQANNEDQTSNSRLRKKERVQHVGKYIDAYSVDSMKSVNEPINNAYPSTEFFPSTQPTVKQPSQGFMMKPVVVLDSKNLPHRTSRPSSSSVTEREEARRSYDKSEDSSDYSTDYGDYIEKPRRTHRTNRKRPYPFDSTRRLPKEHRGSNSDDDDKKRRPNSSRFKSHRHRTKSNDWKDTNDDSRNHEDGNSAEREHQNLGQQQQNQQIGKTADSWSQLSPNIEISHSSGLEIGQVEKPKVLVPLKMGLVPLTGFDHANALGNSQDFDVSNAVFHNYVTANTNQLFATPQSILGQNHVAGSPISISTPLPDIIIGQQAQQTPMQTFLVAPTNLHERYSASLGSPQQYLASTLTPLLSITPNAMSTVKTATPRLTYANVQSSTPSVQDLSQSNLQALNYPNLVQLNAQGPNLFDNRNNLQSSEPYSNNNKNQGKKNIGGSDGQYLTSASLKVSSKSTNDNQENVQGRPEFAALNLPGKNTKSPSLMYQSIDNTGSTSNRNLNRINVLPTGVITGVINPQLPVVGAKNVEIVNPNMKPSPLDPFIVNSYGVLNPYQGAVLTTPIPILATTGQSFVANPIGAASTPIPNTVSVQNYVDSLTAIGTKPNGQISPLAVLKPIGPEKPPFNPIEFVPNLDILQSQSLLNNKFTIPTENPFQKNLNLVPLLPGGNFFKPTSIAQTDLLSKPKLTSDLEKYAEEMFKESLRTIYSSQKWNNDKKIPRQNQTESNDVARLKNELQRLKATLSDTKMGKEILEAHQSENKYQITSPGKSSNYIDDKKKANPLLATLEQLIKAHPSEPIHIIHGGTRTLYNGEPKNPNVKPLQEYLTPPKPSSYLTKIPFQDKPTTIVKKRPPPGIIPHRYAAHETHRPHPRPPNNLRDPKLGNLETASSNIGSRYKYYNRGNFERSGDLATDYTRTSQSLEDHQQSFDYYPTFTTSVPENIADYSSNQMFNDFKSNYNNINHPRMHNLFGLLMKNKQLPTGSSPQPNYFQHKSDVDRSFDVEKQSRKHMSYADNYKNYYQKKSDRSVGMTRFNDSKTG